MIPLKEHAHYNKFKSKEVASPFIGSLLYYAEDRYISQETKNLAITVKCQPILFRKIFRLFSLSAFLKVFF